MDSKRACAGRKVISVQIQVQKKKRKSRALGTGVPQCLARMGVYSLNVVSGCAYECAYCKFRARKQTPADSVVLYSELPEQLEEEVEGLKRRGTEFRMVLFNSASDAFFGNAQANEIAARCIQTLLDNDIHVSVATKGLIPPDVLDILANRPHRVIVSCNLAAVSESFQRNFEPRVPPLAQRLAAIKAVGARGVPLRGRIEPLMPMENDSREQVERLLSMYRDAGVREVVVSYLQMTPEVATRMRDRVNRVQASMLGHWYKSSEGRLERLLDRKYRRRKYEEFKESADRLGMRALICACRNADMYSDRCFIVPPRLESLPKKKLL